MTTSPDTPEQASPRVLAGARLAHRRRRISVIRRRVVASSLTLFVAVWGAIFVPLRAGQDPALARSRAARSSTAASVPAVTSSDASAPASAASAPAAAATDTTASDVAQPSAVVTRQS